MTSLVRFPPAAAFSASVTVRIPRPVLHQTTRRTPLLPRIAPPTVQDAARSCVESRSGYLPLTLRKSASRVPAARSTRFAPFPSCRITSHAGTVQELPRTATPNRNLCESTLPPFRVALSDTVSLYFLCAFATFCTCFAVFRHAAHSVYGFAPHTVR